MAVGVVGELGLEVGVLLVAALAAAVGKIMAQGGDLLGLALLGKGLAGEGRFQALLTLLGAGGLLGHGLGGLHGLALGVGGVPLAAPLGGAGAVVLGPGVAGLVPVVAQGGDLLGLGLAAGAGEGFDALFGAGRLGGHLALVKAVGVLLRLLVDEEDGLAAGQLLFRLHAALPYGSGDDGAAVIMAHGELHDLVRAHHGLLVCVTLDVGAGALLVQHLVLAQVQVILLLVPDGGAVGVHAPDGHLRRGFLFHDFFGCGVLRRRLCRLSLDLLRQREDAHGEEHRQGQQQAQQHFPVFHFKKQPPLSQAIAKLVSNCHGESLSLVHASDYSGCRRRKQGLRRMFKKA